jgi:hypothetical protein
MSAALVVGLGGTSREGSLTEAHTLGQQVLEFSFCQARSAR